LFAHDFRGILEVETNVEMKVMKAKVTERGLIIPKEILEGAEEVEYEKRIIGL
jgi:hypothetical protein